jgi:hypothetical protein
MTKNSLDNGKAIQNAEILQRTLSPNSAEIGRLLDADHRIVARLDARSPDHFNAGTAAFGL